MTMKLKGRCINPGKVEGEAIVTKIPFSFLGEIDPMTGKVNAPGHELEGQSLLDKIFVFPTGKGSSAGPIVAYRAVKAGKAPKAMICVEAEPVIALAAITADIPMVDKLEKNPLEVIKTGDYIKMDAGVGGVEIIKKGRKKAPSK